MLILDDLIFLVIRVPYISWILALHQIAAESGGIAWLVPLQNGALFGTAPLVSSLPAAVQPHQYKCPQVSFYIFPRAFYSFRSDTTFFNTFEMIMVYGVRNEFSMDPFFSVWLCNSNTVYVKDYPCPVVWPWHYSVTERIYWWDVCSFKRCVMTRDGLAILFSWFPCSVYGCNSPCEPLPFCSLFWNRRLWYFLLYLLLTVALAVQGP